MTVLDISQLTEYKVLNLADDAGSREIKNIYCCDLLSIAMSHMPEAALWVTVMSNMNTLAVAGLTDVACVILAEDVAVDEDIISKAKEQNITLLSTAFPVFQAANLADEKLNP